MEREAVEMWSGHVSCVGVADDSENLAESLARLASFPGRFVGGGKTAWYRLFAHARNTPRFVGYRICT